MSTIKRYKIFSDCECGTLSWDYEEDVKGMWCDAKEVTELEQELTKLKESQTQKSIIKLCNRVDKAEADKAELVEFVRDIAYNDINKNDLDIDWVQKESWELLNKHTDKPDAL